MVGFIKFNTGSIAYLGVSRTLQNSLGYRRRTSQLLKRFRTRCSTTKFYRKNFGRSKLMEGLRVRSRTRPRTGSTVTVWLRKVINPKPLTSEKIQIEIQIPNTEQQLWLTLWLWARTHGTWHKVLCQVLPHLWWDVFLLQLLLLAYW